MSTLRLDRERHSILLFGFEEMFEQNWFHFGQVSSTNILIIFSLSNFFFTLDTKLFGKVLVSFFKSFSKVFSSNRLHF